MEYQMAVISFFALIVLSVVQLSAANEIPSTPAICEPGVLGSMAPHIRKDCMPLENSNELSNEESGYITDEDYGKWFEYAQIE